MLMSDGAGITAIKIDTSSSSWLQRIRLAFKSSHVAYLEQRIQDLEEREKVLLEKLLVHAGYGVLGPHEQREAKPSARPANPLRVLRAREAEEWAKFNEMFPSADEIAEARKG
jgi:hypothetical protein